MGDSRRYEALLAMAGRSTTGRKDIERALSETRKRFAKANVLFTKCTQDMESAQAKLEAAEEELDAAKQSMIRLSKQIQTMDLSGADGVRSKGDLDTFVIGGKEFHVDLDDLNDIRTIPIKEYEKQQDADDGAKIESTASRSVFDQIVRSHDVSGRRFR